MESSSWPQVIVLLSVSMQLKTMYTPLPALYLYLALSHALSL